MITEWVLSSILGSIFFGPAIGIPQSPITNGGGGGSFDDCNCVPYYRCVDGRVVNDTEVPIIINRVVKDDVCPGAIDVCCGPELGPTAAPTDKPSPITKQGCGFINSDTKPNGDKFATYGEFPWMVALVSKRANQEDVVYCGGSLIHERVVLAAAHCLKFVKDRGEAIVVRVGEWDTSHTNEPLPHKDYIVERAIQHPEYNHIGIISHDISLLVLREPVPLNRYTNILCLPRNSRDESSSNNCIITGWGKDKLGTAGGYHTVLKKRDIPIVPRRECEDRLRLTRLGNSFNLSPTSMCAGGGPNQDACSGDGGGPLMCPIDGQPGRYKLEGVISWGVGCGFGVPGVYSNVPYFRDWIDQEMAKLNYRTEYNY